MNALQNHTPSETPTLKGNRINNFVGGKEKKDYQEECHGLCMSWKRISSHKADEKRIEFIGVGGDVKIVGWLKGVATLLWASSQFFQSQDKDNSCWRAGIR